MVKSKKILELLEFFKSYSSVMHFSSVRVVECVEANKFFVFGLKEELCLIYCLMAHRLESCVFVLLKDDFLEFCSSD